MIVIKVNYSTDQPVIKVNYDDAPIYISTTVDATYIKVDYGTGGGGGAAVWGDITGTLSDQLDLQAALDAKVPYTGATGDVDLGEYELKAGQIELDQSPTGTAGVAVTRWNDTIGSTETTLKGGNVVLKNGVDLVARVVNKVTPNTTLTKAAYQAVKVSGAQGQRLAIALAQANNDNNSADTLGLVTETIPTNQEGFIMTVGNLEGINTTGSLQGETWADGDVLYLSPTTAGAITNIKPNGSTGHIVVIGYVEYAHANNGKIYVKIMNGWELDELHNVFISSPANNDALIYESSTSLWKNKSIATALGYTPGTVSSVALTVPTGLVVTGGSPITTSGTIAVGLQSGYSIPTTVKQGNWDDAYTFVGNFPTQSGNSGKYLTTDGSTLSWGTINLSGYVPTSRTLTINGTAYDLSADRSWTISTANIYNSDGTLTGNRTVTQGNNTLTFSSSRTSGSPNIITVTQTQSNAGDTGDGAISIAHTLTASSATNELVVRAMAFSSNNNLTGGGVITNHRIWNVASSTQTGTTTTNLDQIYIEKGGTASGTVTNNRAIRINNMQGTNQAAFVSGPLSGTNNTYLLLGDFTIPTTGTGKWGIYQSEGTYNNYFAGKVAIGTDTIGTYALDVQGTAFFKDSIKLGSGNKSISSTASSSVDITFGSTGLFNGGWSFITTTTAGVCISASYNLPSNSVQLQVDSTTKGFLQPRMTTTQRDAIVSPATGLSVYNTTTNTSDFYNGTSWVSLAAGNIYTADGTLTGNRTVTANGNSLTFLGGNEVTTGEQIALILQTSATNKVSVELLLNNTFTTTGKTWRFRSLNGGDFDIVTGTSRYFYIASDGKVVINSGTAIASAQFSVSGTIASNGGIQVQGGLGSPTGAGIEFEYSGGTSYFTSYNRGTSAWLPIVIRGSQTDFYANNSNVGRIYAATGNWRIQTGGTFADDGYKLDVQGTGRFTDNVAMTKSNAEITFGSSAFPSRIAANGQNLNIYNYNNGNTGTTGGVNIGAAGTIIYLSAGAQYTGAYFKSDFADSGVTNNGSHTEIQIAGTVNMTFAGTGIQRSLYVNKTITAASDYRAIEWTNSAHWGLYGSGASKNYLAGNLLIGTTNDIASSILTIASTTKGFLPPRMTETQKNAISTPATGLIVYQTDGTEGLYERTSTAWRLINASGSGGGITRSVNNISTTTTAAAAANTDYVYLISGTTTLTLPTAAGNTNRYTLKNVGTNTVTINTTSSQTIDGSTSITMAVQYIALDVISDGTNWNII